MKNEDGDVDEAFGLAEEQRNKYHIFWTFMEWGWRFWQFADDCSMGMVVQQFPGDDSSGTDWWFPDDCSMRMDWWFLVDGSVGLDWWFPVDGSMGLDWWFPVDGSVGLDWCSAGDSIAGMVWLFPGDGSVGFYRFQGAAARDG